ncbi:MAG: sodium-translocating pyrophosphatase [Candidatus Omnitrophota bacterium]|nr:MAG: sodium-translocating pyrophosphatase [Candidatus Omnitrophota bacterium]
MFYLIPLTSLLALGFVVYLIRSILKQDEGTEEMKKIARAVEEGAKAFLRRQYKSVGIFFTIVFLLLLYLALRGYFVIFVPFAFLSGGFFSGLCGYIGMIISTKSSVRTTQGCKQSLNKGLRIAFSSGTVMGLCVVGIGLIDLSIGYFLLDWYYTHIQPCSPALKIQNITNSMLCFGMGASSMALFARVGGGIFTKAADVGADLVGKIEKDIPEDDPRNPAVIADNVGDNVGDVAGMGADLYESYVDAIIATMALAVAAGLGLRGVFVPLSMACAGIICSIIGTFFVRSQEEATQGNLLSALRQGVFVSASLIAVFTFFIMQRTIGEHIGVYFSLLSGLIAGLMLGISTEYFTSSRYRWTRSISQSALTGPATVVISGLSTGMLSTLVPVITTGGAILASYYFAGGFKNPQLGLYGVGISAVGLLSTLGITLASDAYGPVADNAGGIAEMSHQPSYVRKRTDALDALGNTTAATGKGFAIGSAALTALALIAAYREHVHLAGKEIDLSLLNPRLIVGLFTGAMLPFFFSSLLLRAVGKAAEKVVVEVRRQFKEIKGLMEGKAKPDYARCIDIVARAAHSQMILPSLSALTLPVVIGLLIGVEAVVGLLTGALVSGFVLAIMMANSGGAWDNAKKYIEEGNLGGKGSEAHKSAVVGDTVGDPCKDTAGPSLNILIKLMSMVSMVFASFVVAHSLFK